MTSTTAPINYGDPIYITNGLNVLSGTTTCEGIWPSMTSPTFLPYENFTPYGADVPDVFVIYGPNGVLPPPGTPVSYGDQVTILSNRGTFWKQLHGVCLLSTDSGSPTPFVLSGSSVGPIQAQAWGTSITSAANAVIIIQDAPDSSKNNSPLWADDGYGPSGGTLAVTTANASQQPPAILTFWSAPASSGVPKIPIPIFPNPASLLFRNRRKKPFPKWMHSKLTLFLVGITILAVGFYGGSKAAWSLFIVFFLLYFAPGSSL